MTFTEAQQIKHRKAFIETFRQKAWDCACHADFISKELDQVMAHYKKLQEEDGTLAADIKELENALDYHTVENREKRKGLKERRDQIAQQLPLIAHNSQQGTQAMQQLLASVENNLALVKHAETWSWKEVETNTDRPDKLSS
jgi:uncharacterized protein (DUF3084 family)